MRNHQSVPRPPLVALSLVASLVALACGGAAGSRRDASRAPETGSPSGSRIVESGGRTQIRLSAEDRRAAGIVTAALAPARARAELAAPATVLDLTSLADGVGALREAAARLEGASAERERTARELARATELAGSAGVVSAQTLDAARAAARGARASEEEARAAIGRQAGALRQEWGEPLASWAQREPARLGGLLERREALLLVSLPAASSPPPTVTLAGAADAPRSGSLLGAAPRTDPRTLAPAALYRVADPTGRLVAGAALEVSWPGGDEVAGSLLPRSAVLLHRGRQWVWVEESDGLFARHPVELGPETAGGWIVPAGALPAGAVVVTGGEALLSEELRGSIAVEGEGAGGADDDD